MIEQQYFEDYCLEQKRVSFGRTISETDFIVHAGHTGDFFPHHMDAEWCKTQSFGERIAHGTMVFAIGVGLTASVINPVAFTYGYDRLRFIKPVHIGDTIRSEVTVAEKRDDPKRAAMGQVVERLQVFNQKDELVMVCDHVLLVERGPAE